MNEHVTAEEMAERWNVSVRQVQMLCRAGKIEGAHKFGKVWALPADAPKPTRTGKLKPERRPKHKER